MWGFSLTGSFDLRNFFLVWAPIRTQESTNSSEFIFSPIHFKTVCQKHGMGMKYSEKPFHLRCHKAFHLIIPLKSFNPNSLNESQIRVVTFSVSFCVWMKQESSRSQGKKKWVYWPQSWHSYQRAWQWPRNWVVASVARAKLLMVATSGRSPTFSY